MKLTIRNKLIVGFCGVLVLMTAVAGIGAYAVFSLRHSAYEATRVGGRLNAAALEIQVHNLEAERRVNKYLARAGASGAEKARMAFLEEARFEVHEIQSLVADASRIAQNAQMRASFQKIAEAAKQFDQTMEGLVTTAKAGSDMAKAKAASDAYEDAAEALHEAAEDGEIAGRDASQASLEKIDSTSQRSVTWVIVISLVGLVLCLVVSYKLARAILVPVEHLKDVAENVSLGNLEMAVRRYSEDEIGDLADSFERMVTAVKFFRMECSLSQTEAGSTRGER